MRADPRKKIRSRTRPLAVMLFLLPALACGGSGDTGSAMDRNDLDSMGTARVSIDGHEFEVWIADESDEIALGLMHVEAEELAPTRDGAIRGMLFVFPSDRFLSFWMKDTPTALDIAFIRSNGTIVRITTMQPFDTTSHTSGQMVRYALEVRAGTFASLGIDEGDVVDIPAPL